MAETFEREIFFRIGYIYQTPFTQEIPRNSSIAVNQETISVRLSQYNKNRIRDDKKGDSYNLHQLKEIARILSVYPNQSKGDLVEQILKKWGEEFPTSS